VTTDRYNVSEIQFPDTPFPAREHWILLGKRGSEAHGTYLPPTEPDAIDDRDVMGICIPPLDYYFGTKLWDGAEAIKGCWDVVLYPAQKFISLLTKQNPNVLAMLWLRDEDYLDVKTEGRMLIGNRDLFRARKPAFDAFVGYARGQFKRMTHFQFQGYMGAKRKALAEKHGYDCKNAAHLMRLLTMGVEYLSTGKLTVFREKDRERLIAIKTGKWELTDVKIEAERLFKECERAYADSVLPETIDLRAVNALAVEVHASFFARRCDECGAYVRLT
jgi:predicted nucleotidyltransferase